MKLTLKIKGQDVTVEMEEAERIWKELSGVFASPALVPDPLNPERPAIGPWDFYKPIPWSQWDVYGPIPWWKLQTDTVCFEVKK